MSANSQSDAGVKQAVQLLRRTDEIRRRARLVLDRARSGGSENFRVHEDAMDTAAAQVAATTRRRYPDLQIPYHSRWRHFEAGAVNRAAQLDQLLNEHAGRPDRAARARAQIDLAVVSVLLDAGAGAQWSYFEADSGGHFSRSEGLAVASFHAFTSGLFSSDPDRPLQVDAAALMALTEHQLAQAFQASDAKPLVGLSGRVALLRRLGRALATQPDTFGQAGRPGCLFDTLTYDGTTLVHARDILALVLDTWSEAWPSAERLGAVSVGDCWHCPGISGAGLSNGWMPFHKLSQWLTYSLLEPFEWAGVGVEGVGDLTGLPEYRNGGLLIDSGVLAPRPSGWADHLWSVSDTFIVEWRALTVALLDDLAPRVRHVLGCDASSLPLACVLEGGTWAAGRELAQSLRSGQPPLHISSDGTVF